jgi:hypothetical protein
MAAKINGNNILPGGRVYMAVSHRHAAMVRETRTGAENTTLVKFSTLPKF